MATETITKAGNSVDAATVNITQFEFDRLTRIEARAGDCSSKMFEVIALIHAVFDLQNAPDNEYLVDTPGLTDRTSRIETLLLMARNKASSAIGALDL